MSNHTNLITETVCTHFIAYKLHDEGHYMNRCI